MEPVFQAEGVTKTYRVGEVDVHALRGVDVSLAEGELVCLLGPSGSGKSTLLNILGGLDLPTSGRVFYRGGTSRPPAKPSSPSTGAATSASSSSSTT